LDNKTLNIVKPLFPEIDEFVEYFDNSLKSGQVTNNSPWVREFEKALAEYVGIKYCSVLVNGEMALILLLRALNLKGSVAVPSYTFSGTVHALMWNNLEPVFVDIDPDTLNIDCNDLRAKIKPDTSAILAVPIYGNPCDINELEKIANEKGIKLLFDSAPAFGAQYNGKKLGNFGSAEIFSFHATKVFSTMEGGAVFTNDEELHTKICELRNFGQFAESDCNDFGLNGKMTEVCALIGLKNLPKLDSWVKRRNELVNYFANEIKNVKGIKLQKVNGDSISNHLYLYISVSPKDYGTSRDSLMKIFERHDINTRRFFCNPVHKMKCYEKYSSLHLPNTEYASQNGLSLPLYSDMTFEEMDRIIKIIKDKH
jgi:dTDP-4-amino-4,6-dideoxygalactose transaminase